MAGDCTSELAYDQEGRSRPRPKFPNVECEETVRTPDRTKVDTTSSQKAAENELVNVPPHDDIPADAVFSAKAVTTSDMHSRQLLMSPWSLPSF